MDKFDIIIQGGQSNSEGTGIGPVTTEYIPDERIMYLAAHKTCVWTAPAVAAGEGKLVITYLDKPFELNIAEERGEQKVGDFALTFAKEYIKSGMLEEGRKLLIVRGAVGGTGFVQTQEWGVGNILHEKMVELSLHALFLNPENRVIAFLWHQGEHEAVRGNTPKAYKTQLIQTVSDVRGRLNLPALPFIAGDFVPEWRDKNAEKTAPIIGSIREAVRELGNAEFVESDNLKSNNQEIGNNDDIHFSKESLHKLGVRYFNAYKKLKKE